MYVCVCVSIYITVLCVHIGTLSIYVVIVRIICVCTMPKRVQDTRYSMIADRDICIYLPTARNESQR